MWTKCCGWTLPPHLGEQVRMQPFPYHVPCDSVLFIFVPLQKKVDFSHVVVFTSSNMFVTLLFHLPEKAFIS